MPNSSPSCAFLPDAVGLHETNVNWYPFLRFLLFQLDAEQAHGLACLVLGAMERVSGAWISCTPAGIPELSQNLWGAHFPNPVGLAAGFDKNAGFPHVWQALGFGFAELGTVTALAQPGNPRPRMFRLPEDKALINRMGFNNQGAEAISRRLRAATQHSPIGIPLGINIGKSRLTAIEDAAGDYLESFQRLARFATYVVVNVSSPNTPGLRDLQGEEHLHILLDTLQTANSKLAQQGEIEHPRPILVKLAPDLSDDGITAVVRSAREHGAAGIVATNTTIRRDGLRTRIEESGGLSGAPLRARATEVIQQIRSLAGDSLTIIGTGGIFTAEDAYEKIRAGASLVQVYTGFIYRGPTLARQIVAKLPSLLRRDGFRHLRDAIGASS